MSKKKRMQPSSPSHGTAVNMHQRRTLKAVILTVAVIFLTALMAFISPALVRFLGRAPLHDLEGDIAVNDALPTDGVKNIALFGLDTRENSQVGHSDAIIILSLDYEHNKIKLTSIARDSFVWFDKEDYPYESKQDFQSKITHAFQWGGQQLAVKTINRNFDMNIRDYVFVNFYEFAEIIDYIGGVDIDVDNEERQVMNQEYCPYLREMGIDCPDITVTGLQHLNGGQALAYSRNRYTGNDIARGNRQKEVLEAMFVQAKNVPLSKYPTLVGKVLDVCHTNLTNRELLSMANWAVSKSPAMTPFSLPSPECNAIVGNDVRYDLELATAVLHTFIYERDVDAQKD